ncbi:MAG: hypothetical protein HYS18_04075 [Burkholderiales bacterium]|nr:hypothetical protein [Burkholderiales bacterium]
MKVAENYLLLLQIIHFQCSDASGWKVRHQRAGKPLSTQSITIERTDHECLSPRHFFHFFPSSR